jgi:hypothetical protein
MVRDAQFPELTTSPLYDNTSGPFTYPALDNRENWNCRDCAYQMVPTLSKPKAIERIMRHFGMRPEQTSDRARVIFWDDSKTNIEDVKNTMPKVRVIRVPRNGKSGNDGGCGITRAEIEAAFPGDRGVL